MKVPFSWLKEYVDINISAQELEEKLFSCGFEVEELTDLGKDVENVVVGEILRCEKHPDADRLTVCTVDCGPFGTKQIVTAATNVFEGARVPCALDGATVKHEGSTQKIKTGKLRGVTSEGMFCSGEELGINDGFYEGAETNGILILDAGTPLGGDIRPVVGIDEYIFDIAVTANRPDCQSVYGIAREVAAVLKLPLRPMRHSYRTPVHTDVSVTVTVEEPALCPRYVGQYVKDVKIGPSPRWMRRRLALLGIRPISNIVDITNYVLLEVGQPMHAFDRNFLRGGKIVVRRAAEGETITTLDEKQFTLHPDNLLICDGEGPVALAGVMGGLNSEIKEETSEVFFEAASFARDSVRKTARALGQHTDSSARFEKGMDVYTPGYAMDRALSLVEELGCGTVTDLRADALGTVYPPDMPFDWILDGVSNEQFAAFTAAQKEGYAFEKQLKRIDTSFSQIDGLLGIEVPRGEAVDILERLGFGVKTDGDALSAVVPYWRTDVDLWPDLAEEIIRMYGYGHIGSSFLEKASVTHGGLTAAQKQELRFKELLAEEGYSEALGFSFYSPKDFDLFRLPQDAPERKAIAVLNPIGEDLSLMRTFLAPTMLANIVRNVRRGNESGRLFELANVYLAESLPPKEQPEERKTVSFGLWGEGDFFDVKGAFEGIAAAFRLKFTYERGEKPFLHPGITAAVKLGEREVGWIGELHPAIAEELALERRVVLGELDYAAVSRKFAKDVAYRGLPRFPEVKRDLAAVVPEQVTCAEAEACILHACKAAKKAELFDVYRDPVRLGKDKKSMAFRITFVPGENEPITPELADGYFKKIVAALNKDLGAELR